MKRFLIFLLAAGPLFVFGQRLDQSPAFKSFQNSAPGPVAVLPLPTVPALPGLSVSALPVSRFTVRKMQPDGMPCLVPLRMPEPMPMSLRGNGDPLPNGVPRNRR
jgi:hypothetical protein